MAKKKRTASMRRTYLSLLKSVFYVTTILIYSIRLILLYFAFLPQKITQNTLIAISPNLKITPPYFLTKARPAFSFS
jgi:hypothetical protein